MQSTSSLPLLPGLLWAGWVVPDRVLSINTNNTLKKNKKQYNLLAFRWCRPYKNRKYHKIVYMKAFFHKHHPGSLKLQKWFSNWMNIPKLRPTPALIKRNFTIFSNTTPITSMSLRMDPRTMVGQRAWLFWTKQFLRKLFQGKALSSQQKPVQ